MIQRIQRVTHNLGVNTVRSMKAQYDAIEAANGSTARCCGPCHPTDADRVMPIREFYLHKKPTGAPGLQTSCKVCQKQYRVSRTRRCLDKYASLSREELDRVYTTEYGPTKLCSRCGISKAPSEFPRSNGMECGLHNQCTFCARLSSTSQGLRDFILQPDRDSKPYVKDNACRQCGKTDHLAIDHIVPLAKGGNDTSANKQTLCRTCNSRKSDTLLTIPSHDQICQRYHDPPLPMAEGIDVLSVALAQRVATFVQTLKESSTEELRASLAAYLHHHNLRNNVDRLVKKIQEKFND